MVNLAENLGGTLFFFKNIYTRAIQRLELQVLPKQLTTRLYFIMLQSINVFFIKDCELGFLPQSKRFSSILFGGKKPTTTNPKNLLHKYYVATFPSPYFGFFLTVALQFSVINTDKKFWRCRIRGCNLYSEPKKTRISPKQLSLLLPKNCFRKSYFCL